MSNAVGPNKRLNLTVDRDASYNDRGVATTVKRYRRNGGLMGGKPPLGSTGMHNGSQGSLHGSVVRMPRRAGEIDDVRS
jgi:hypothetical protein